MVVSQADRDYMDRLAAASAILQRETGWADEPTALEVLAIVNAARARDGRVALEEIDAPDELEFHERARRLGLLCRDGAGARRARDPVVRGRGDSGHEVQGDGA